MYLNSYQFNIMWKEFIIGIIFLSIVRTIIDVYIVKAYKKLNDSYKNLTIEVLKKKAQRLLTFCAPFAVGPWNKQKVYVYNGTCWLLASVALIERNDKQFMEYMMKIRQEESFELKSFILAIYYRAKKQTNHAVTWYKKYFDAIHYDSCLEIIIKGIFETEEKNSEFYNAINQFKNPAIIQLFKENGIEILN